MLFQELFSVLATKMAEGYSNSKLNNLFVLLKLSGQVTSQDSLSYRRKATEG